MSVIYEEIFKKNGFSKTQQKILQLVGFNKIVLEIGASTGYMTKAFLDNGCVVDVIETDKKALLKIPKKVRKVLNYSIEDNKIQRLFPKDYDFIIMADVLEHLVDPANSLKIIHQIARHQTRLIISLPNIASWVMRKQLFFKGDFEYQESGLLDKTHLHFFTVNTLPKLLSENGWKVEKVVGTIIRLPFEKIISKIPIIHKYLAEKYKNLSYYHFLIISTKK